MSLFLRLTSGLKKTSSQLGEGITGIFTKRPLDQAMLDELEELLIMADMGPAAAARLIAEFGKERLGKDIAPEEVKALLAAKIEALLQSSPMAESSAHPQTHLIIGVNGNGKTTTIGKLAAQYKSQGKKVMLAAADTFRAAAVEQLVVWAERAEVLIVTGEMNADPASVAYKALERARGEGVDVLLIDTAGRLHNKENLMAELKKIAGVLKKLDPSAPHQVIQVLDATTGQNALSQVEAFKEAVGVTGLIVTKLDGTAKGGVVVALAEKFKLPILAIGVGEQVEDLQVFDVARFSQALVGL